MRCEVHILTYNEAEILPYTLRHYRQFSRRIIVHDSYSTDGTREIAAKFPGVHIEDWDTGNALNDLLAMRLKSTCWHGTNAEWVIVVDADELIYFPEGAAHTLDVYKRRKESVIKPVGFEMCSDTFPTGDGQLYDEVQYGARDDRWYSKPVLFSPLQVKEIEFDAGAHHMRAVLHNGLPVFNPKVATQQPFTYLLHCKHLGPVSRITARYTRQRSRLSEVNVRNRWGNFDDPEKHALDKRGLIQANLERVIMR